ncbi:hypothetical protein BH10BDE1_BH10BDE1_11500 [soil metagenome]
MKQIFIAAFMGALFLIVTPNTSTAHEGHGAQRAESAHDWEPKPRPPLTAPSQNYSGKTPIDRGNGNFFSVGTYGAPNPDYEAWATSPTWAVSLAQRPYSFEQKDRFIESLDDRIKLFEAASWNYGQVSEISRPEGQAHAKQAAADLAPKIEKARDAWKKAKSANKDEWENAQNVAKRSFLELQSFYYSMHKNVISPEVRSAQAP